MSNREDRIIFLKSVLPKSEQSKTNLNFFLLFYNDRDSKQKTENRIRKFIEFKIKHEWPMLFKISEAGLRNALLSHVHWIMPRKDSAQEVIFIFNVSLIDQSIANIELYQKMACYLLEITMASSRHHKKIIFIADLRSMPPFNSLPFSITDLSRGIDLWYNACPLSFKNIYLLTSGWTMKTSLKIALVPFLSSKMSSILIFVDTEFLIENIGYDKLPNTLNGNIDMYKSWQEWVECIR